MSRVPQEETRYRSAECQEISCMKNKRNQKISLPPAAGGGPLFQREPLKMSMTQKEHSKMAMMSYEVTRKNNRTITAMIPLLLLAGCVRFTEPPPTTTPLKVRSPLEQTQHLQAFTQWNNQGVLSVQNGKDVHILAFQWQQQGPHTFSIHFSSSLNLVSVQIQGQPGHIELIKNNKERWLASTPEQLLREQLGWDLPLSNLYYWIRSLPTPASTVTAVQQDGLGHLKSFEQQGWHLQYLRYENEGAFDLPLFLRLQQGRLKVTVVVKKWSPSP